LQPDSGLLVPGTAKGETTHSPETCLPGSGWTFRDALTRQRTDGALVRVITPVYPGEGPEDAEKRRLRDTHLSLDMPILFTFEQGQVLLWLVEFQE
jgi:hypothetical protein